MFYWQDVKYALRLLSRNPGFTLLTVIVLAGGLGLSIFTFSFLHTAMLKPLPLPGGEAIVRLTPTSGGQGLGAIDAADLREIRSGITTLTDLGAYTNREMVVGTGEGTRSISATATEWNIFRASRTAPVMGRGFAVEDQAPGAEPVIVLTWTAWNAVFAGDPAVLHELVRLNGVPTRVIGILPRGYAFPVATDAYVPIRPEVLTITTPGLEQVMAYARVAPGVERRQANAELTGLLRRVQASRPKIESRTPVPDGLTIQSYPMAQIGDEAPLVLTVLNALATLILLLACINVTNLLLARANERARETAVRLALGAPRGRLIMQSIWESVLLCLMGGMLATGLAVWGLEGINTWAQSRLEGNLAFWWVWGYDRSVLLAAGGFVTLAIVVLGGVASRRAVNTEINAVLQEGGSRGGGRKEGRIARLLVVVQVVTVSLLLFFGSIAGMLTYRVVHVNFGYDTRALLSADVDLPADRYPTADSRDRLFHAVLGRMQERAEVNGAVLRTRIAGITDPEGEVLRQGVRGQETRIGAHVYAVLGTLTPMGIALREGRFFDARDDATGARTVLVSQAMADQFWPGRSPVGEQLRMTGQSDSVTPRTVVGVVGNVLLGNPLGPDRSEVAVYLPLAQTASTGAVLLFRHRGSEPAARSALHEVLGDLDPLIATDVRSFEETLSKLTLIARSVSVLFGGAFAFALLLAVSGTYGLMARSIGRRTREIGVRRALGATDRTILVMLLGQGGRQLGVGALIALPFTMAIGWGFSRFFPLSLALSVGTAVAVSASISMIVLAATWLPTRRAIAIEPRDALWRE